MSTTAGNGPGPSGRTSAAGMTSGDAGVALEKDTAGPAQAARQSATAHAAQAWRGMPSSIHRTPGIESAHATPRPYAGRHHHRGSGRLSDAASLLFGADPTPGLVAFAL